MPQGNRDKSNVKTNMDATKKPLLIPPEFSAYAEKHGIFQIYEVSNLTISFMQTDSQGHAQLSYFSLIFGELIEPVCKELNNLYTYLLLLPVSSCSQFRYY